jgi:hypothetical protein
MDEFFNPEEIMELSKRKKPKYGLDKDIEDTQKEMEEVASAQKENPEFVRGYDQRLIDLSKKLEQLNSAKRSVASTDEIKPETKSPIVNTMGQDNSSAMEKYGMDVTSEFPNYKAFEEQPVVPQMSRISPSDKREVESLFGPNKTEMPEGLLPFSQSAQPSMPLKSEGKAMPQMAGGVRAPVSSDQKQMQDFVDAQKAQGSDYMNRLKEAEQRSRDIELASMLGKAFSQIGGGIAQAKAKTDLGKMDTSVYDQLGKTSQRPLEELKRSVEMEKDDPNSDASKSLRSIAKADLEKAGVKLDLGSMSYNQLTSVFPHLSRMAERIEAAKLRQQQASELRSEKKGLELKENQNKFLQQSSGRFSKDKSHEALFVMKDAVSQINDYLANPTPVKAQSLAYVFGKINDPGSVVRESELKLFGKAGSLFDRFGETIRTGMTGKISPKKAQDFRDYVQSKMNSYESDVKTKLSPYIEQGKRYGLDERDVVSNVAGPEYYQNLFSSPSLTQEQRKELEQLRKKQRGE